MCARVPYLESGRDDRVRAAVAAAPLGARLRPVATAALHAGPRAAAVGPERSPRNHRAALGGRVCARDFKHAQ